jgi:tetratricopeptide (TPR) repeat protein
VAQQAVGLAPREAEPRLVLAQALTRLGRHADAAAELRIAAQVDPLRVAVHRELGYASARQGDFEGAISAWERFLRAAPPAETAPVLDALAAAARLRDLLAERAHG